MNETENKELETLVKNLFLQKRKEPKVSLKKRLKLILDKCLHELTLRDLMVFSSYLLVTMLTLFILISKLMQNKPQRTKP